MPMKLWVEQADHDKLDENAKALYKKQPNGKFKLDVEELDGIDDPQDMRSRLGRANQEAGNRRTQIEKWERLGKTPDEIQALLDAQAQREQEDLEKKGQWDTLKNQMVEQHTNEKNTLITERDNAFKEVNNYVAENAALAAIQEYKGSVKVLLPHVLSRVKVQKDEATGKRIATVLGEDGNPRVNAEGKFITPADLVKEMRADTEFSRAFEGPPGGGGGTPPGSGGGGGTPPGSKKRSEMSTQEKAAFIREHGQTDYLKLPA